MKIQKKTTTLKYEIKTKDSKVNAKRTLTKFREWNYGQLYSSSLYSIVFTFVNSYWVVDEEIQAPWK